jgi:hypothetical protein
MSVHFCGKDFVVKEKIRLENLKVSLFKWLFWWKFYYWLHVIELPPKKAI